MFLLQLKIVSSSALVSNTLEVVRSGFTPAQTPFPAREYFCHPTVSAQIVSTVSGRDSDLEAFNLNPSDGSLAPLAFRPGT